MNNLLIGIGLGGFLYWAGGLFLKFAMKTLKERKENELVKTEETMERLINKVMDKKIKEN